MTPFLLTALWILVFLLAGKALSDLLEKRKTPRPLWWIGVLAAYASVHLASLSCAPFLRMVLLCTTLLVGMKALVYAEWRREGGPPIKLLPRLAFSLLWFGMDPRPWTGKRRATTPKTWLKDFTVGLTCLALGLGITALTFHLSTNALLPVFIGLSLAFHFGVLRCSTGFWRACGVPVRPLFRNPLATRGFNDFWSRRWNLSYSQMMARVVLRPLQQHHGKRNSAFAVFLVSGLFHELAITVPVGAGYGLPTLFFLIHGLFTTTERHPSPLRGLLCGAALLAGLPLLFPAEFTEQVILPARDHIARHLIAP